MQLKAAPYKTRFVTEFPLINAVLEGLQDGRLFDGEAGIWFILHKAGFSYLSGAGQRDLSTIFSFLLSEAAIPAYFHVYDASAQLIDYCAARTEDVNIRTRKRVQLKFPDHGSKVTDPALPRGYLMQAIDGNNFDKLSGLNLRLGERFWRSDLDFRENGFGFFASNESGEPVSICYSACVADKTAEIDVATLPAYQRKGLAKAVVCAFTRYCQEHGIVANWDCFEDNQGSLRTAQSIGFRPNRKYDFLSIFNKRKQQ